MTEAQQLRMNLMTRLNAHLAPLQVDLGYFAGVTACKTDIYKSSETITTDEIFFWYKCLTRSFFAFADGLASSLCQAVADHAPHLALTLSSTARKNLARRAMATKARLSLALTHFPALLGVAAVALPEPGGADDQALDRLIECRDSIAHPKSMRDLYPPALLAAALPAMESTLQAWQGFFSAFLVALGVQPEPPRPRTFQFEDAQVDGFAARLAPFYELDGRPEFMKMILALMADTGQASRLLPNAATEPGAGSPTIHCAVRNFARTVFPEIEGTTFILADYLASRCGGEAPTAELLQGRDEEVRGRIADIVDAFSRKVGEARGVTRAGAGWDAFPRARRFRDRVTHPPPEHSVDADQADAEGLLKTRSWWHVQMLDRITLNATTYAALELSHDSRSGPGSPTAAS